MKLRTPIAAALAIAGLANAGVAQAQAQAATCLTEQEVSGFVVYAMPSVITATQTSCGAKLSGRGFLATGGQKMAQRYAAKSDASWPQAKSAFFKLGKLKPKDTELFGQLPDEAVRPLLDALIVQMVSQEIKPGSCSDIERLVEALDMLEPAQAGKLSGVIASLALAGDKQVRMCPDRHS